MVTAEKIKLIRKLFELFPSCIVRPGEKKTLFELHNTYFFVRKNSAGKIVSEVQVSPGHEGRGVDFERMESNGYKLKE